MEARAQLGIAVGNFFPQVQEATGSFSRNQLSRNIATPLPIRRFDLWTTGFDAAWELDFWGRFQRGIEAAEAELDASIYNYDDVLVCLLAEVAATYVEIRAFELRLQYAEANVENQRGSLQLAESRFEGGATSELDVTQARGNLAQTESLIPVLQVGLRQAKNRLAILLGTPPRDLQQELGNPMPIPTAPSEVAVGIPAELLRRRPDIRRAERETAAQSARIGIAVTDLYPHFTLAGAISVEAGNLSRLFTDTSATAFVGPSFRWDILNYGRIVNNVRVQDARFEQLAVTYENTVLEAAQEVEDALVAFLRSQEEVRFLEQSAEAAERSVELALVQYTEGLIDFDRVFNLQGFLVVQQDQLAARTAEIALNLIGVYKAMGGGWQIRFREDLLPVMTEPGEIAVEDAALSNAEQLSLGEEQTVLTPTLMPVIDTGSRPAETRQK